MDKQVYEFIAAQTGEKIVQRRKCKCGEEFAITDKDMEFYDKISPVFNGTKYEIPAPTLCPDCRQQRRLTRRNERKLYKRKCDLTGKSIISIYSPESPYKVYDQKERWSDKWNPMDYGRDFDFTHPFFEQFDELIKVVPKISIDRDPSMENSDYANYGQFGKNLYLCVNCYNLSDSYYSTSCFPFLHDKEDNNIDSEDCTDSSDIYFCLDIKNSKTCFFSNNIEDCFQCYFSEELIGCSYCICCTNQTNKKYLFLNEAISEEEFNKIKNKLFIDSSFREETIKKFNLLKLNFPIKYNHNTQSENVYGDYLINCKNVQYSYFVGTTENGKYLYTSGYFANNMYDGMNSGGKSEFTYETLHMHLIFNGAFLIDTDDSKNIYYSYQCYNSSNLFSCIGLRNKQYCILNKQYTKEEYEALIPKIIEHMKSTGERGELFPASISPFGYNETVANEYFPLEKVKALKEGFKRQDKEYPINVPEGTETIDAQDLPEDINDVTDEILKKAVICEVSGKPFRIVKPELEFYRKHNLPLPRKHPDIRHLERLRKRAPRKLYLRTCDNCGKQVISVYPQNSEFKVYCDDCYNKKIY